MVQSQDASSGEEKIKELLENDDPEITRMWNEDYGMINHPINVIENPMMEVDDVEVQIQETASEGSGVLEFENTMPENNLPKEPAHLQQDCLFGVNDDCIASFEQLGANSRGLGEENGQLELNTLCHIQQPMIPDFANTPQEEFETLCETEESSFVADLTKALLDHEPLKDISDAIRWSKSTLLLDQQSWQSDAHLQDMLL
ncbi:hypothetical protein H5410_021855 [Solanum commersonii]|uniref:Uncharacterized protein n=1 Tax=Solanum commersonii TaxID=4109 RepID=A0A9J5ZIA9_SOLCO|nr:hypothetical protein H5410_021855 [Solanum commersonii]